MNRLSLVFILLFLSSCGEKKDEDEDKCYCENCVRVSVDSLEERGSEYCFELEDEE